MIDVCFWSTNRFISESSAYFGQDVQKIIDHLIMG